MQTVKIVSYNIHKSRHFLWRQNSLNAIIQEVQKYQADIIMMQEVFHSNNPAGIGHQSRVLGDAFQKAVFYEPNAHYPKGHHGNATFCNYNHLFTSNFLLTQNRFEHRGIIYTVFELPRSQDSVASPTKLHLFNTHLNLRSHDRLNQAKLIVRIIKNLDLPAHEPLIIGGDFNDWLLEVSPLLIGELGVHDSSLHQVKASAHEHATFPAIAPQVNIDRFYYKNLKLHSFQVAQGLFCRLISDHLPIVASFEY